MYCKFYLTEKEPIFWEYLTDYSTLLALGGGGGTQ
jgi:hypothetical protein